MNPFKNWSGPQQRWWLLAFMGLFGFFFWLGYRYIVQVNSDIVPPPVQEPIPPKIPRQYSPNDTLLDLKLERDRERSQEAEQVQELLDKVGLSDQVRKAAEEELWRLTQNAAREHELENLLLAKGFKDCLVTIGQRMVTVVVGANLQPEQASTIGQLAAEVTALGLDRIQVVERSR
ncbi:SpoIIIAH-like protein [Hydrogenispora ethanolica]|uniref:SpoIIIAH-like protein n=1 Tax=Hydrogenispora ethanolica TaxID=1082276 RepID=A0A4R1RW45_HYDET|nr:SpoIIIAH-like family protein [Hydrogenispora ethanolica]TCL70796.1 SpoIIIAH-like protein [Hydrogenispora ethanolica]